MTGTRTLRSYLQSLPEGDDTKLLSPDLKKVDMLDFASQAQGSKADSAVQSIVPGFGISVDASTPQHPKVTVTGGVGLGSVTSVAMTVPAGLAVAGSPINTSGTFAITHSAGYQAYTSAEATKLAAITLGAASGNVPVLDSNGHLLTSTLPALAIGDTFTVTSQAAMLALTAQRGDVAIRTDINTTYRLVTDDPTVLANWAQILVPGGGVTSIASLTGVITAAALKTAIAIVVGDITDMSANARSFNQAANYAAMRTAISLVPGTNVQAYSALLLAIAGLTPTNGNVITGNGTTWVSSASSGSVPSMIVRDEKTSGTSAGTFTSGSYQTRTLNTVLQNTIAGASLSSNQISLPAGTYEVDGSAPAIKVDANKARLYNVTAAAVLLVGTTEYNNSTTTIYQTRSIIQGVFTLASTSTIRLEHICGTTATTIGFGFAASLGDVEVDATLTIRKVA